MLTCGCPCAHHEDIWERGGTTPHIIKPVLLHNRPLDNNLATILSKITFLLHKISLAIKWNKWLFHSLHILVSLFLWVMIFGQNYWHRLVLSGTAELHDCLWTASHYNSFTFEENALSTNWPGGWMCQRKISWPCQEPNLLIRYIRATACQTHQLHYHSYFSTVSLIMNICVRVVTDCLYSSHFWYMC